MKDSHWITIATVGYQHSVSINENRAAHGGVCHLEARQSPDGLLGRKTNSNGTHLEVGDTFPLDEETFFYWLSLGKCER